MAEAEADGAAQVGRGRFRFVGGRWIVAGTHMTASALLEMMAHGATPERIVELCPYLCIQDIRACLRLGAEMSGNPLGPGSSPR